MSEIIRWVVEYGVYPVMMAALIFVFAIISKGQERRLNLLLERTEHGHSAEEERENGKQNAAIDAQLSSLLANTGAGRVAFFEYHNGGYGVTGRSFQKMSMMNEQIDLATAPVMSSCQNLPRRMYPILTDRLTESGKYLLDSTEDIQQSDPASYYWWTSRRVCAAYAKGVYDNIREVALGFVVVEYNRPFKRNQHFEIDLSKVAQRIGGILQAQETSQKRRG